MLFSRDGDPINQFVLHKSDVVNGQGDSLGSRETGDWDDEEDGNTGAKTFKKGLKAVEDRLINPLINNN